MKFNKKILMTGLLVFLLSCFSYSENNKNEQTQVVQKASVTTDIENINKIIETINSINNNWVGDKKPTKEELYQGALKGIVATLDDKYSTYLTKKEYQELNESIDGEYVGVGMSVNKVVGDYMEVISPFIGSPAYEAGIQIGDIIIKVDDEDIIDLTATETTNKLKGEENTKVKVTIVRKGVKNPIDYVLTRRKIKLENVEFFMLDKENKIGYISLLNFGNNNGLEIKNAIKKLEEQGMDKLIFDLRTNPGGNLNEAIEIASLFVDKEDLLVLKYKNLPDKIYKRVDDQVFKGKMVVLTNNGSASASEVVTGILKDYKRVTVIGEKTFGKGIVQSILPYKGDKGDALKLTIAEYFTPSNNKIHKVGIEPDIYIYMNPLLAEKGISEETPEAKANNKKRIEKLLIETEGEEKAKEMISKGDVQLKAAIDVLLGKKVKSEKEEIDKNKKTKLDKINEENNK